MRSVIFELGAIFELALVALCAAITLGCAPPTGGTAGQGRSLADARVRTGDAEIDARPAWDARVRDAEVPDAGCDPGSGDVLGQVCAPNGRVWLVGATVSIEWTDPCTGEPRRAETVTDGTGAFALRGIPAGVRLLEIRKGSFSGQRPVSITADHEIDLSGGDRKTCLSPDATTLAVVTGRYDRVEELLRDLGLTFDLYDGVENPAEAEALLTDAATLDAYDIVFLNCGINEDDFADYDAVIAGLRGFVAEGGSLYVSDYSFFLFEDAFPEAIDFHGDDTDWNGEPRAGGAPQSVEARIRDDDLRAFMQTDTITVDFPETREVRTAHWVVADAVGPRTKTLLEADVTLCLSARSCARGETQLAVPLLASYQPAGQGAGVVVFTSFHEEVNLSEAMERVLFFLVFML